MLSSYLLSGAGIGAVSTILFALLSNKSERDVDRKKEYGGIFCIILLVSVLVLFLTGNTTDKIVQLKGLGPTVNINPPF